MPFNKNICDCPSPPGGRAVCEITQMAICRVLDGQASTECISPSQEIRRDCFLASISEHNFALISGQRVANWTLAKFYEKSRPALEPISREDLEIIHIGIEGKPVPKTKSSFRPAEIAIVALQRLSQAISTRFEHLWSDKGWSAESLIEQNASASPLWIHYESSSKVFYPGPESEEENTPIFELLQSSDGKWCWELKDAEGATLAISVKRFISIIECVAELQREFGGIGAITLRTPYSEPPPT